MGWMRCCAGEPGQRQSAPGSLECLLQPPLLLPGWALWGHSGHIVSSTSIHHTTFHRNPMGRLEGSFCSCQCHRCQGNVRTGRAGEYQDYEQHCPKGLAREVTCVNPILLAAATSQEPGPFGPTST